MRSQGPAAALIRAFQVVLGVGALALCIRASASVLLSDRAPQEPPIADETAAPRVSVAEDRFGRIAERDLFHRKVEEVVAPPPPPVVETTLHVELLGTLVRGDAALPVPPEGDGRSISQLQGAKATAQSLAILLDVDGKVRTLAKGDLFADERAKLVEIERGRIVLEQDGRLETVTLEESALAAKNGPPRPTYRAPQTAVEAAAVKKAEEVARMQREVQRRMREAMPQVGAAMSSTGRN